MNLEIFRHFTAGIETWLQAHMAMNMPWGTPHENKIENSDIQVPITNGMDGVDDFAVGKAMEMQQRSNERRAQ